MYHRSKHGPATSSNKINVSAAAPLDERLNARTQLEHVVHGLYADPTAALTAMRSTAYVDGADAVRRQLEADFTHFGEAGNEAKGTARERAQKLLQESELAAKMEEWLKLDHTPARHQLVQENAVGPDVATAEPEQRREEHAPERESRDDVLPGHLSPDEQAAYEQIEAYAEARERASERTAAEARLHALNHHRASLDTADGAARSALRTEIEGTYVDPEGAQRRIEESLEQDGTAVTARRVRSGELFGPKDQKSISSSKKAYGVFTRRDAAAESQARERVAQRIETIAYQTGDLGKWGTFQPQDGPPVHGVKNVRAALDRETAKIAAEAGMSPAERRNAERSTGRPAHPSQEEARLERSAKEHLNRLSPASRDRVAEAVQRSGSDRMASALGHLQTVQTFTRTIREGMEGPVGS